ncbi:hypothetical protein N8T08_009987 [Aspergillus melleus]|uniref:Uncharacterized protein n=1 Tax=Aspergillus melleus TaxID=138277 RepID=A0ACC3ASN3_9EURO|nr:hypothetical protein N8T08_009987 [Aspergillus melleus]
MGVRKQIAIAVAGSFFLLQILFLANMSYLYATQFRSSTRFHNMKILYVDYDGGAVGQSVLDAYATLRGDSFPTLQRSDVETFPTPREVRAAVCSGDYWGAVYANTQASTNLTSALQGGPGPYDSANTLTYIWNGARYPAMSMSAVYSSLQTLFAVTRSMYYAKNASEVLPFANLTSPTALQAFLDPIQATEINLKVTEQGTRVLYNTVSFVMPVIQQFFFMMALNGISAQFKILTKLGWHANGLLRMCISAAYTFVGALFMVAYIWSFRESWEVNGNQFALSWMAIWLYMHINFLIMDILTTFVPMQFMPFCVLTWVIVNVASTISPFELSPGFFRWGYALPAHETYQVLVQIWSNGCDDQLYRALPVMFSWWVVALGTVIFSVRHRCNAAVAAERAALQPASRRASKESESSSPCKLDGETERQPGTRNSSVDQILPQRRRDTAESIRLEQLAYGPSFPAPLGRENHP